MSTSLAASTGIVSNSAAHNAMKRRGKAVDMLSVGVLKAAERFTLVILGSGVSKPTNFQRIWGVTATVLPPAGADGKYGSFTGKHVNRRKMVGQIIKTGGKRCCPSKPHP